MNCMRKIDSSSYVDGAKEKDEDFDEAFADMQQRLGCSEQETQSCHHKIVNSAERRQISRNISKY